MAFNCPTVPPTAAFSNEFFGFPSKYNALFNKESTGAIPTPFAGYPTTTFPNTPFSWPSTFERSNAGAFPWANTFGSFPANYERFGAFPWANTFGSFPFGYERFGSFPWSNAWTAGCPTTPASWTGSFPWSNTWSTGYPTSSAASWTGSFPWSNTFSGLNNGWNFNNDTLCATTFRPSSEAEYFTLKNPIRFFEDGTRGLWLCFDLKGYKPEEVCVTVNKAERCIIVEATHDVKESGVSRKFYRKFVLPEYMAKVDITKIDFKSFFGPDGMFYVEGCLPRLTAEEYSSWPAYPYTFSCWTNPAWCWANNAWTNNATWAARPWNYNNWCNWTNWANNSSNVKSVTCKLI